MFLTELSKITPKDRYLNCCINITKYLESGIFPTDKWHDFEPFFSCTHHSFNDFDRNTQNHLKSTCASIGQQKDSRNCIHLTNDIHYLQVGEQILARLSLFQQLWNMPYIGINTFGGFCSQNTNGELNDARQALFVRTYMEYYLETGKKDYMERGIAALRASWTLQLLSGDINHNVRKTSKISLH